MPSALLESMRRNPLAIGAFVMSSHCALNTG